jgi:hypothetical protein
LHKGKLDEAIAIFKINAENFSEYYKCRDGLGEAYMTAGMNDPRFDIADL